MYGALWLLENPNWLSDCQANLVTAIVKALPQDTLFLHDMSCAYINNLRALTAQHPHTPAEDLARLASDSAIEVRTYAAKNPSLTRELQEKLAQDTYIAVRASLAENPLVDADILHQLTADPSRDVWSALASNPHCFEQTLHTLAEHITENDFSLALILAKNPQTPASLLESFYALSQKPPLYLDLSRLLAMHPHTPSTILEQLAQHSRREIRHAVVDNPNATTQALTFLASAWDWKFFWKIRQKVAEHPFVSREILQNIVDNPNEDDQAIIFARKRLDGLI